jgi:hypothetical protein
MKNKSIVDNHLTFSFRSCPQLISRHITVNLLESSTIQFFLLMLVFTTLLFAGCARIPTDYVRTGSTAFQDYQSTAVGKQITAMEAEHPGESGFAIIRYSRPAFTARIMLTELAEKSLDVHITSGSRMPHRPDSGRAAGGSSRPRSQSTDSSG